MDNDGIRERGRRVCTMDGWMALMVLWIVIVMEKKSDKEMDVNGDDNEIATEWD